MTQAPVPGTVVSERLYLPLLTASRQERMLDGDFASVESEIGVRLPNWWLAEHEGLIRFRLGQIKENPGAEPWLLRAITLRPGAPGTPGAELPAAIGLVNFHGPPDDRGFVEVGYELRPEYRGRGYAREAVRALFDWAWVEHGVTRFRAAIAPDNERSLNLVAKLGMVRVGAQWDEDDGLELIFTVDRWGQAS